MAEEGTDTDAVAAMDAVAVTDAVEAILGLGGTDCDGGATGVRAQTGGDSAGRPGGPVAGEGPSESR